MSKQTDKKSGVESGSVIFHHIGPVQFWMTSTNRIFAVQGDRVAFPHLHGSSIMRWDDATFKPGEEADAFALKVLRKQREIRMGWLAPEEEDESFQFS